MSAAAILNFKSRDFIGSFELQDGGRGHMEIVKMDYLFTQIVSSFWMTYEIKWKFGDSKEVCQLGSFSHKS